MTYQPGELDQRVTFQRNTAAPDGGGGSGVPAWSDLVTVWAKVRPRSGKETAQGGGTRASASYLCVIRNRSDLTEADRLTWQGEPFDIRFIAKRSARSLYLEIEIESGVAE